MSSAATRRQEDVNRSVYHSRGVYRYYLSKTLSPAEAACVEKYDAWIRGRDVLDVGVGAGRTTHHLAPMARRYEALDYSPVMVDYVKRHFPGISVRQADFSDLSAFDAGSFDFVFATDNVIDALSHEHRLRAVSEVARVLRPGGVFAFTSHNLNYKRARSNPWMDWSANPIRMTKNFAKFGVSWWNHLRIGKMRKTTPDYSLLNDRGHFYSVLHYYVRRADMRAQLELAGLSLRDAFDHFGNPLPEGADDSEFASLLYAAQACRLQDQLR
jgi:SAM-dependent methyltransferase